MRPRRLHGLDAEYVSGAESRRQGSNLHPLSTNQALCQLSYAGISSYPAVRAAPDASRLG